MAKIKYEWMKKHSYFKHKLYYIQKLERKLWNFIELKNLNSITKQYIKAVENDNKRFKYNAPKLQVILTKLYKIFEIIFSF